MLNVSTINQHFSGKLTILKFFSFVIMGKAINSTRRNNMLEETKNGVIENCRKISIKSKRNFSVPQKKVVDHKSYFSYAITRITRRLIISGVTDTAVEANEVIKEVHGVDA